jgi:TctA family transporter
MFTDIINGAFSVFDPIVLIIMMAGVVMGLILGILPGLSGITGLAILIPLVFGMEKTQAFALLMGMYAASSQGGALTAILLNIPGTGPNAATLLDGFPMTQQGHAGRALGISLTASALGGLFGGVVLALSIPILRPIVMAFGSPESLIIVLLGIAYIGVLASSSPLKGLISGGIGVAIGFIGYQEVSGHMRFTFDSIYLFDGVRLVPMTLGLFGIPAAIDLLTSGTSIAKVKAARTTASDTIDGFKDIFRHFRLFLLTSGIGTVIGIIPGAGGDIAAWVAYGTAKQTSKHPEKFGTGCVEGILAPESCTNAKEGGSMIPTLAFGIPGSAGMAVLLGAFLIVGLTPGPLLLRDHVDFVFSLVLILILGNIVGSVILALASALLVKVVYVPGKIMGPIILILVSMGAYSREGNLIDVLSAFIIGVLGYAMRRSGYSTPALFLGYILGEMGETYFYLSLEAYGWKFVLRPIVMILIAIGFFSLNYKWIGALLKRIGRTS